MTTSLNWKQLLSIALGGGAGVFLAATLAERKKRRKGSPSSSAAPSPVMMEIPELATVAPPPPATCAGAPLNVRVIFASQTGTAHHYAKAFTAEAKRLGFSQVDLVDAFQLSSMTQVSQKIMNHVRSSDANEEENVESFKSLFSGGAQAVVLFVSTYGEGAPTDSCFDMFKSFETLAINRNRNQSSTTLSSTSSSLILGGLPFAVFALGDSTYREFCKPGKQLHKYLTALGAAPLLPVSAADAHGNLQDEAFDNWKESLWPLLSKCCQVALVEETAAAQRQPPAMEYVFSYVDTPVPGGDPFPAPASIIEPTQATPLKAMILSIQNAACDEDETVASSSATPRTVRLELSLRFHDNGGDGNDDAPMSGVKYNPGDHCGILPRNSEENVNKVLQLLNLSSADASRAIELTTDARSARRASRLNIFPQRTSLKEVLTWYVDLQSIPKKSTLRILASYCTNEAQKEAFFTLLKEEKEFAEAKKKFRNLVGFMAAFPSSGAIPVGHLLECVPRIAPRFFSIASDQKVQKDTLTLCIGLLEGGMLSDMVRHLYVKNKRTASKDGNGDPSAPQFFSTKKTAAGLGHVFMFVRHSTFHPTSSKQTLIMIGPGTGIAPFRGFAQSRAAWAAKGAELAGAAILYHGCRTKRDFLFQKELEQFCSSNGGDDDCDVKKKKSTNPVLNQLRVAYSREDPSRYPKTYVQNLLLEDAEEIRHQLVGNPKAFLYVCGDAGAMAPQVEATLVKILVQNKSQQPSVPSASDVCDSSNNSNRDGSGEEGKLSEANAVALLRKMEAEGRYLRDVWSLPH